MYLNNNTIHANVHNPNLGEFQPASAALHEGGPREGGSLHESGRGQVEASSLSSAHIRPRVEYIKGASLLKTTHGQPGQAVGGGKRGCINGFSRSSRLRLMRLIASVRRDAELPCFVTLTYPDQFPTVERAKRDLKIFLQRMGRRFPEAGYIWKLEPQQRGAPHYHLLVWGVPENILFSWVIGTWYEIAGQGDQNHFRFHAGLLPGSQKCVSRVRSFKGVWYYAAKYLGKTFEVAEWGKTWTGRFWGVGNRSFIPFGSSCEIELGPAQVVKLMRLQRRFAHLKVRARVNSLTIFCTVDYWVERLPEMLSG